MAPASLILPPTIPSNLSMIAYPGFSTVDFVRCDDRYSQPVTPTVDDCLEAFNSLPQGRQPVTWYNRHLAGVDPQHVLPLVRTAGKYHSSDSNHSHTLSIPT